MGNIDAKFYFLGANSRIESVLEVLNPEGMYIGENVLIQKDSLFQIPYNNVESKPRIVIENGCNIGTKCTISAANRIVIKRECIIAANVYISDYNHKYENIGIPIMYQGISSFENEVVIGEGTLIANNCVIEGNVKIGRGCTIEANSLVNSDIPDYCVAVGNPAKVIKTFNFETGKWVKIKDSDELISVLKEREKAQPILSICIPTYNRSKYLDKCLKSIFDYVGDDKNIEVVVSDNNSEDNTKEIVDKYMSMYNNLKYFKNEQNIGVDRNITEALNRGTGKFLASHGDDDYFAPLSIYKIINKLYENRECSVFYMFNRTNASEKKNCGINNFIKDVSFYCTFISGIILNKNDYKIIEDKYKFIHFSLNQVYLQLLILKDNKKYCVLYDYFLAQSGERKPCGYNFAEVFINNYLEILNYFKQYGLTDNVIKDDKKRLMESMILPWYRRIKSGEVKLDITNIDEYINKYYSDEPYFEELLTILKSI